MKAEGIPRAIRTSKTHKKREKNERKLKRSINTSWFRRYPTTKVGRWAEGRKKAKGNRKRKTLERPKPWRHRKKTKSLGNGAIIKGESGEEVSRGQV